MGFPAIAMAGATGIQALGSIFTGNAEAASEKYAAGIAGNNALIAQQNANYATEAGDIQATNENLKTGQVVGAQRAGQGASGLDVNSGSNVDVQASTRSLGALDALTIRNQAARQAYGYETQSQSFKAQSALDLATAKNAKTAGYVGATTSLLSGASSYAQKFGDPFASPASAFSTS